MGLISADALIAEFVWLQSQSSEGRRKEIDEIIERINNAPTVDAVPVIRCKDCKFYREGEYFDDIKFCFRLKGKDGKHVGYNFSDNDFCSRGERKEE